MNTTFFNRIVAALVLGLLMASMAFSMSACNTIRGAGKDVEKAGAKIQEVAQ